ncbi:MAG: PP2C family protein-serine/threonine phosphatase [Oscillospiraceae bacterium]|nr:PP2C family protein-serine/threonine phosphatase [Oscillospiraceae bacterium]
MKVKSSIKHKVAAIFAVVGLLLVIGVAAVVYAISYRQVVAQYSGIAFSSAHIAAAIVGGSDLDGYLSTGPNDSYRNDERLLRELKALNGLVFLYVVKPAADQDGFVYVFDIFTDENDLLLIYGLGDSVGEAELEYDVAWDIYRTGKSSSSTSISNTEYGHLATAYVPVRDAQGNVTALACADVSMDTIMREIRMQTFVIAGVVLAIAAISLFAILLVVNRKALKPVIALSRHMAAFNSDEGNFTNFEFSQTGDELQAMAESYNAMVGDIKLYIENLAVTTAEKERIGTELDVATRIQASLLPCIFPAFPEREEFDIHASMIPAKEVGGDFYDFFFVDENTLALVVADVSGKGVPAALFMVIAKTLIKNNAQLGKRPKAVFETVNNMLCENNSERMFVTAFMGYLDLRNGKLTYVNAGHNPPLIKKGEGGYEFIKTKPSMLLAFFPGREYREDETVIEVGDTIYLYTDGVTEAMNSREDQYSTSRLLETANRYDGNTMTGLLEFIERDIELFVGGTEQNDDITMLGLRMN